MVIRGHGAKMNKLWLAALRALMSENSIQEAAERVGIHRNTLSAWLRDEDFQSAYKDVRRHRQAALMRQLVATIPVDSEELAACAG